MISFITNIARIIRITCILAKYQIFTYNETLHLPKLVRFFGIIVSFILPWKFFIRPTKSIYLRLPEALEELGPSYIKLGQILSTRPDLVGIRVSEGLKRLQDKLPPFPESLVKQKLNEAFGEDYNKIFAQFNYKPIAAASVAQVHKATIHTGEEVAVKILRPNIRKIYSRDIELFYMLARFSNKFIRRVRRLRLLEVIKLFEDTMKCELDLRIEAASASELSDQKSEENILIIPKIYWDLTNQHIMVSSWVEAFSLFDKEKIQAYNLNPKELSRRIAVIFFNQAFRYGFFHGDMHPGNIFVNKEGKIVLVDFGIMGRIPEKDRLIIAEILLCFTKRNYLRIAQLHVRAGYVPRNTDIYLFSQACRSIGEPILNLPANQISIGKLLAQLLKVTEDFAMQTQPQLLLLQKSMVIVEGIGQYLDPNINMWLLAQPWIEEWAVKNISYDAKIIKTFKKILTKVYESLDD